jgi:preprotein translocase subunit YajC
MQNIILIVLVVGFAAFIFWNSRKRKRQTEDQQTKMVPGARVMLSFGVYGTLLSVNDEKVTAEVEVAPGTVLTVHRQTLSRVVEDEGTAVEPTADPTSATSGVVLNGVPLDRDADRTEPEYGVRTSDPADVEAAKRKSDD